MPTKQEVLQNYFSITDDELLQFIKSETFVPGELNGIFSYKAYNNVATIVKAFLEKCKPTQQELDFCFTSSILNQEILDLLLPLKPSATTLGNYVFNLCNHIQMHAQPIEALPAISSSEIASHFNTIDRLMQSGATLADHQNYDAAKICFDFGKIALFKKYFDTPAALRWHLQFCCRPGNEKLKAYVLSKPINYNSIEGFALLNSAMYDDVELFYKTLPLVTDVNADDDTYCSLLDSAIVNDDLKIVKAIIAKGGQPQKLDGKNVLLQAMNSKSAELPALLLAHFNLDVAVNDNACLFTATTNQKVDIVKLLLEKGADVHCRKNACLKIAKKNKNVELENVLKQFGASDVDITPYKFHCDLATAGFETLWQEWLLYCKANFPSAEKIFLDTDNLKPIFTAAPEADIKAFQDAFGMPLNKELKVIYKHCTQGEYLFFGMCLMSPKEMLSNSKSWLDLEINGQLDLVQNYPVYPAGTIRNLYINRRWLSFANDLTTNYISIDYDPAENGKIGQIINSGRDQWERFVVAENITALARKVMTKVEANDVEITPEGYFNLKAEGGGGFLFDVLSLIKENKW